MTKEKCIDLGSFMSLALSIVALTLGPGYSAHAQREAGVEAPNKNGSGGRFFAELQRIFGRFRDSDLQRVFDTARPVQCPFLVSGTGEWHEVAFFNEYRQFGDWYRTTLNEVRSDPAVYNFKGSCDTKWSPVQVITEFPVDQSLKDFKDGRIRFRDIHLIVNAPVIARVDGQTGAYVFDLPYLYRVSSNHAEALYALTAPTMSDRYAPNVNNHWECKSVTGEEVTYQFLICRTTLLFSGPSAGNHTIGGSYGASAFSILADGKESTSSVKLTFEESAEQRATSSSAHTNKTPSEFRDPRPLRQDN